jgi:hypothetical protein
VRRGSDGVRRHRSSPLAQSSCVRRGRSRSADASDTRVGGCTRAGSSGCFL